MERASRKVLTGIVVSTKAAKTIIIEVETYKKHPLYSKRFLSTKKFAVHDELEKANIGDKVEIMETRPLSKTKRFRLKQILKSIKDGK